MRLRHADKQLIVIPAGQHASEKLRIGRKCSTGRIRQWHIVRLEDQIHTRMTRHMARIGTEPVRDIEAGGSMGQHGRGQRHPRLRQQIAVQQKLCMRFRQPELACQLRIKPQGKAKG